MHPRIRSLAVPIAGIVLVAVAIGVGFVAFSLKQQTTALQTSLAEQKSAIVKKDGELAAAKKALAEAEGRQAAARQACSSQQDELKQTLEAFAKQAGACEVLRHKLNVAGYTS